jgi:predicted dehydrogenase
MTPPANGGATRRGFLGASAAGLAAATARRAAAAPNDAIGIGFIGVGSRASTHLAEILARAGDDNLRVPAVCDVNRRNLARAAGAVEARLGMKPATFTRYPELLARPDVDAVVIATPDFAHGRILNDALAAGKDVYIEKPMTIDLDSANRALDLARRKARVVQAGTQRRSDGHFRGAAKLVAEGALGTVSRASAAVSFNEPRWQRQDLDLAADDVDWDAYLLDLPKRPFDPHLLVCWQLHRETSNGMPGLWMTHYADALAMVAGLTYPDSAVAAGGTYVWRDGREHADTFSALLTYPEGLLFDWSMNLGTSRSNRFELHGTGATLDLERWTITPDAPAGAKGAPVAPIRGPGHMENWIGCIRSRQAPAADIAHGHRHVVATVMAAEALRTGRRQVYDPASRTLRTG